MYMYICIYINISKKDIEISLQVTFCIFPNLPRLDKIMKTFEC